MLIQYFLIAILLVLILRLISQFKKKRLRAGEFFGWLALWLLAMVVVWRPDIASFLALKVGVGRGADLAIYLAIILIFYILFRLLMRLEKMEKDITKIVRHIALKDRDEN